MIPLWNRVVLLAATLLASLAALPPMGDFLMRMMLTQMLVQIPLIFAGAAIGATRIQWPPRAAWLKWSAQGAPGLLFSTMVLAFWMTPIALDHAAADPRWEVAKIASIVIAGVSASISWRLASNVIRIFYVGNMVWMTITAGMLYQESTERLCNAYLWDDQTTTGQALVGVSVALAVAWMVLLARRELRRVPQATQR